jgi:hypothetical protein
LRLSFFPGNFFYIEERIASIQIYVSGVPENEFIPARWPAFRRLSVASRTLKVGGGIGA